MSKVTLVGKLLAKTGNLFLYAGPAEECKECKLFKLCHSLKEGWTYRIVKVRKVSHRCPVHFDGVSVVEVEELPLELAIPRKEAIEGAIITVKGRKCRKFSPGCAERWECNNPYLKKSKVKILKVLGPVDCGTGEDLVKVVLENVEK